MIEYRRVPKDYSYIPRSIGLISAGLASTQKTIEELEKLKQLKIDRSVVEEARKGKIIEAAAEIHEAMGLPDNEKGYNRALKIAETAFYPLTEEEKQDPFLAVKRIANFENSGYQDMLRRARLDRFRTETTREEEAVVPEKLSTEKPAGGVSVVDNGVKRTTAWPTSISELQQTVQQEELNKPQVVPVVKREPTAEEAYRRARELGIEGDENVKKYIAWLGQKAISEKEFAPETTQPVVAKEVMAQPITSELAKEYPEYYPKEMPKRELTELDEARIDALRATAAAKRRQPPESGEGVKISDLTRLINERTDIENSISSITDKLRDPRKLDVEKGETFESLLNTKKRLEEQLNLIDNDIKEVRKRLEIGKPEPVKEDVVKKYAETIKIGLEKYPPKGYVVSVDEIGNMALVKKGKKNAKPDADMYRKAVAQRIIKFAISRGLNLDDDPNSDDVKALSEKLKTMSMEQIIGNIIKARKK